MLSPKCMQGMSAFATALPAVYTTVLGTCRRCWGVCDLKPAMSVGPGTWGPCVLRSRGTCRSEPCWHVCCIGEIGTAMILQPVKKIYDPLCYTKEKLPQHGKNRICSVLWGNSIQVPLVLHKSRVPCIWRVIRFTHYLYSSFYSISLEQLFY